MSYTPTQNDIVTDLRRCFMASFSSRAFEDENVKTFLEKAEYNLEKIKNSLRKSSYLSAKQRLEKAKNPSLDLDKRREDLLTASSLLTI